MPTRQLVISQRTSGLLKEFVRETKPLRDLTAMKTSQELLNATKEFVDTPDIEDNSLTAFLQGHCLAN